MKKRITVSLSEYGRRIGESHPRAKISDEQVEFIRQRHDEGLGSRKIMAELHTHHGVCVNRRTVARICSYERRISISEKFKFVVVEVTRLKNEGLGVKNG